MTITCPCGELVVDGAAALPYKAHLLPDQDLEDALDCAWNSKLDPAAQRAWRDIQRRSRKMYQCRDCGRLAITGPETATWWFTPSDPDTPRNLLGGVTGDPR